MILRFRASAEHPFPPKAKPPWLAHDFGDGLTVFVHRNRQRASVEWLDAERRVEYEERTIFIGPSGETFVKRRWGLQTGRGGVEVM